MVQQAGEYYKLILTEEDPQFQSWLAPHSPSRTDHLVRGLQTSIHQLPDELVVADTHSTPVISS